MSRVIYALLPFRVAIEMSIRFWLILPRATSAPVNNDATPFTLPRRRCRYISYFADVFFDAVAHFDRRASFTSPLFLRYLMRCFAAYLIRHYSC